MSDMVERYVNNIRRPINDPWFYKGLVLKNGLTVLLISDPNTEYSAASLTVAAGTMCDPKDMPGLAHLCEHLLFCGTKKYSEKNEFRNYLINRRGYYSSHTKLDHTKFYCCIKNHKIEPLLDRFARMFFEPLLDEKDIIRGIATIHFKFKCNYNDDAFRVEQLIKSFTKSNHPINQFGLGSIESLWSNPNLKNISVHDRLLKHFSTWFSSHLMTLVVFGKEDLETLEKLVVPLFGQIEKKKVTLPTWSRLIYKKEQLATKTVVVPLIDLKLLSIDFQIPDQKQFYKSMPTKYLSALFNDEGPTSMITVLKNKGWCVRMSAQNVYKAKGIEVYNFIFFLTNNGLGHVDDIIALLFQYVNMLKRAKPQEWFFREIQNSSTMQYHFKDKEFALKYVNWLSSQMMHYDVNEVLEAETLLKEWRPELIKNLLSHFKPEKIRVTVVAKIFQNVTTDVEKHYGANYLTTKIPVDVLNSWKKKDLHADFKMPSENKFLASDFNLIPDNMYMECDHPQIIYESSLIRCWLKSDTEFKCPKTSITVEFSSPTVLNDPFHANIMQFVVSLFNNDFAEYKCNAQRAGIDVQIMPKVTGLMIKLYGYSHKIDVLLYETINKLINFKVDREQFDTLKEDYVQNIRMQPHHQKAINCSYEMLSEAAQNSIGFLGSINGIKIEQIEDFMKKFLSHGMFMEALVIGNIDQKKTERLIRILEKPFLAYAKFGKKVSYQIDKPRDTELENGEDVVFETTGFHGKNACVFINLQCGVQSPVNNMVFFLFNHIMKDVFFKHMYKERHQYPLKIVPSTNKGLLYLGIIDQSSQDLKSIHTKIENYIKTVKEALEKMDEKEFNDYKISMYNHMLKKPKTLKRKADNYEYDVFVQNYNFNRVQSEVDALKSITLMDIGAFYHNKISQYGLKRRKLTVHVKSSTTDDGQDSGQDLQNPIITDMVDFKRKRTQLYHLPSQCIPHQYYS